MKLILSFFLFPACFAIDTPSSFLRGLHSDGQNRELRRRSCEVSPTVVSKIEAVYESSTDLDIQDIASGALDIISKIEALEMPTVTLSAEDKALVQESLDELQGDSLISKLAQIRKKSGAGLIATQEERLQMIDDVTIELFGIRDRIKRFLERILLFKQQAVEDLSTTLLALIPWLSELISGYATFVIVTFLGFGDGTLIQPAVYFLVWFPLTAISAILIYTLRAAVNLGLELVATDPVTLSLECDLAAIVRAMPRAVESLADVAALSDP